MLRKLLTVALPFLLPFLIYGFYLLMRKRQAARSGSAAPPGWSAAPWSLIVAAAVILTAASLVTYRFTVEAQWEEKPIPSVTGEPGSPPADGGVLPPEGGQE